MMRRFSIALGLWVACAPPALAELEICNDGTALFSIALGFKGEEDWESKGWWNIEPGNCAVVVAGDLTRRYYYYHADTQNDGFWGQGFMFCTSNALFDIVGDTDCGDRGFDATDFREIDTGTTAVSYQLRLDDDGFDASADRVQPDAAGLGEDLAQERGQDRGNDATGGAAPDAQADVLRSDLTVGQFGTPFQTRALFQGCELENGRAFCGFYAGGEKLRAFYGGPTPEQILFALETTPINAPLVIEGDRVDRDGPEPAVVIRQVAPDPESDGFAPLRMALQGDWVLAANAASEITVLGSEIFARLDGDFDARRVFSLVQSCGGQSGQMLHLRGAERVSECLRVTQADAETLRLTPVDGGAAQLYERP